MEKETGKEVSRRNYLTATATGAALLAASALSLPAGADEDKEGDADTLYGHGMVWNRDLPGVFGELRLNFDLRVNLETGIGFGTAEDPVHPEANIHFSLSSLERKRIHNETLYTLKGVVTEANNPANVGLPVRILAQTSGDGTAVAIALGERAFAGAGLLVVIAIIAILIGLLQTVQKI
jgi:hypothetical protein